MENFDTKTIIIIGVGVVLFGAIIYVHYKNSSSITDVEDMKKRIVSLEDVIKNQEQIILGHENIFKQLIPGFRQNNQQSQPQPQSQSQSQSQNKPKSSKTTIPKKQTKPLQQIPEEEEEDDTEYPDTDFDELLKEELENEKLNEQCDENGICHVPQLKKKPTKKQLK